MASTSAASSSLAKKRKLDVDPISSEDNTKTNTTSRPGQDKGLKIPVDVLKQWNVFRFLPPQDEGILDKVQFAYVYGKPNTQSLTGLLVTTDDKVYSTRGRGAPQFLTTGKLTLIPELCGKNVTDFQSSSKSFSKSFCFAMTKDGALYSWGSNLHGRLGHGQKQSSTSPKLVGGSLVGKKVVQLAAATLHVLALTDEGLIHAWGNNFSNELGLVELGGDDSDGGLQLEPPAPVNHQMAPAFVDMTPFAHFDDKVVAIGAARSMSFALTASGSLYQWGIGVNVPKRAAVQVKFKQLASGPDRVLALSVEGSVYCMTNVRVPYPIYFETSKIVIRIAGDTKFDLFAFEMYDGIDVWKFESEYDDGGYSRTHFKSMEEAFAAFFQQTYRTLKPRAIEGGGGGACRSVGQDIAGLWNSANNSDITFSVEGILIHAHKPILTARSQHFERMLNTHWKESEESHIFIKATKYAAFNALVNHIYTDKIHFSDADYENLFDLMQLADAYCEFDLRRKCETILLRNLTVENACFLLRNAPSANATELEERALNFIVDHRKEILNVVKQKDGDLGSLLGQEALAKLTRAAFTRF